MTRAPRLGKRRRKTTQVDELAAIAAELQAAPASDGLSLDDVAAKLATKPRRPRGQSRSKQPHDGLAAIAAELKPAARDGLSLDEVAAKLSTKARRPRGQSLAHVAAAIEAPAAPAREIEGGPLDFALPARAIAIELIGGRGHYERVIGAIRDAHTSVWIATANTKELMVEDSRARPGRRRSHRGSAYVSILALLDELSIKGVELRLLHAELPSGPFREELAQHPRLVAGGLALRRCPRVHMKAVIVDGELLYLGSANWTGAGLGAKGSGRRNFELGMVTGDAQLLDQVQALYEHVWSGGECEGCKLHDECPGPLSELRTPSQLVQISPAPKRRTKLPATSQLTRRRRPRLL